MKNLFLLLLLLFFSRQGHAQNILQFNYSMTNTYTQMESALLKNQLLKPEYVNYRWIVIASLSHVNDPLIVKNITLNQRVDVIIPSYSTLELGAGLYLRKNMLLGIRGGLTKAKINEFNPITFQLTGNSDEKTALTDTSLFLKWRLTKEDKNYAFALIPRVTLATGDEQSFTTDNSTGYGLDLAYEAIAANWLQLVLNIGYRYSSEAFFVEDQYLDYREKVLSSIGSLIPLSDRFALNFEYIRYWILSEEDQDPNEFYAGVRFQINRPLTFFGGVSIGNFDRDNDSNNLKFSAGLKLIGGSLQESKKVEKKISAQDDFETLNYQDKTIEIDVLANDFIPNDIRKGSLKVVHNTHPAESICELSPNKWSITYTKTNPQFVGTSQCEYQYCDQYNQCDNGILNITATPAENYGDITWNQSIYFCNDCDNIDQKSYETIKSLKDYIALKKGKIQKIVIEGHTSKVASAAYNLELSKRRVRNTYKELRKLGVPASILEMAAYGESRPAIESAEGARVHPTSRRVEFRVYEL